MIELFDYTDAEIKELIKNIVIIIDTREKSNSHITKWFDDKKIAYVTKKLDYGDYSFFIKRSEKLGLTRDIYFSSKCAIERKGSLDEIAGNFTKDRDRIEKEFSLYKGKMTMLIENSDYCDIIESNYQSKYSSNSFLATIHSFSHKYNLNIAFVKQNKYVANFIYLHFIHMARNYVRFGGQIK